MKIMTSERWSLQMPNKDSHSSGAKEASKTEASDRLLALIDKHGMTNIPDKALAAIGYKRTADGVITRVDLADQRQERRHNLRDRTTPFDTVTVEVRLGHDYLFRPFNYFTNGSEMVEIENKIRALEEILEEGIVENIIPKDRPYHVFRQRFSPFIRQITSTDQDIADSYVEVAPELDPIRRSFSRDEQCLIEHAVFDRHADIDSVSINLNFRGAVPQLPAGDNAISEEFSDREEWTAIDTELIHARLERYKGRLGDVSEIERALSTLKFEEPESRYRIEIADAGNGSASIPNFTLHRALNYASQTEACAQARTIALTTFLSHSGYELIAGRITTSMSVKEIENVISKATVDGLPSGEKLRDINKLIRDAKSVDEKKALSARKKEIDAAIKNEKILLEGARQFINPATEIAQALKNKISSIQSGLIASSAKTGGTIQLSLDGRYDSQLDKDPGIVSGDCTAGRPLPFDNSSLPLHNIKVFSPEKRHLGNVYLVLGSAKGQPVWHLDAIQIPLNLDWSKDTIGSFVDVLAKEAIKSNVAYITVNAEESQISNYDYIQNAVAEFVDQSGVGSGDTLKVELPNELRPTDNETSGQRLQGNGDAWILWRNPNIVLQN